MKIFITDKILNNTSNILEEKGHEVHVHNGDSPITAEELMTHARESDALITMLSDKIDREFLEQNQHLRVISNYAVGYNNIDVEAASEFNIKIGNTPDVLTEATADLALGLLLNVSRRINESMLSIKEGNWTNWEPLGFIGQSLRGKTLGILGAGRIGRCFADTCRNAFGMKVIYCSRTEKSEFKGQKVEFDELLSQSDVLSVHCDLNSETENLFNKKSFEQMKSTAIFINTARGQVHNGEDLEQALRDKTIWGAGLDVTNPEPLPQDSPLLSLSNVVITPHIGSATLTARTKMCELVAINILNGLNGDKLTAGVN